MITSIVPWNSFPPSIPDTDSPSDSLSLVCPSPLVLHLPILMSMSVSIIVASVTTSLPLHLVQEYSVSFVSLQCCWWKMKIFLLHLLSPSLLSMSLSSQFHSYVALSSCRPQAHKCCVGFIFLRPATLQHHQALNLLLCLRSAIELERG